MSQEMNVLCCFQCKMYQVHIVKKAKKWQCKICNVKQSFKRAFFQGSGKDCRIFVQKLNAMKAYENDEKASFEMDHDVGCSSYSNDYTEQQSTSNVNENEWAEYSNSSEEIQFSTSQTINDMSHCSQETVDIEHLHVDNIEYKCSESDCSDSYVCYEKEVNQNSCYDNEMEDEDNDVGEMYNVSIGHANSENDFCGKSTNDTKDIKNIFDDNEDLDLAIDF